MTIGVAIIGGGIFAREEHMPAVEASKEFTLKAIYSRSLKSAKSLGETSPNADLYSEDSGTGKSYDDLLKRSDIGAVIIALPIMSQPEYIRKALTAGKHVLSEKPIAENLKAAIELTKWYNSEIKGKKVTWSVAENFRYLNSFDYAAEQVLKMGRVLGFRVRMHMMVEGGKYFETGWRKVPSHQGGFLLDGGVHFTAGLRLMLGSANPLVSLSANTIQLQKHLPPVDTVDATLKTKGGSPGTFSASFGTSFTGREWTVACEKGVVSVSGSTVTVGDETKEIEDEKTGVPPEVRKWGEALANGTQNERQLPEEALADLELLEKMLKSGETGGSPQELTLQTW